MYTCEICKKTFNTHRSYAGHCSSHNRGESYINKRQTKKSKERKENSVRLKLCKYCNESFDSGYKLGAHTIHCTLNPKIEEINKKRSISNIGKSLKESHKNAISKSMKIAHEENRAWNIGKSRWNNKPSYPEEFFMKVIETEFSDRNYIREFSIGKYSIDFAWPHKKMAIEIDGEQHTRYEDYRLRDIRKDEFIISEGWKILRVKWKDMFHDTKKWIQISKDFIHS